LEFGYFLSPDAGDSDGVLETARVADRLGYDLLAVQDHPYQPAHLDTLVLFGVILARTERIRVFQDVGNLPLRPPAVSLERGSMLWRLQVNCLHYCSFVHLHHNAEDADFFSGLRDTNPAIDPVIDRLQAEHLGAYPKTSTPSRPQPTASHTTAAWRPARR
jgi:hypothetical protein